MSFVLEDAFKSIHRRLSVWPSALTPYFISVRVRVPKAAYVEWYSAGIVLFVVTTQNLEHT